MIKRKELLTRYFTFFFLVLRLQTLMCILHLQPIAVPNSLLSSAWTAQAGKVLDCMGLEQRPFPI